MSRAIRRHLSPRQQKCVEIILAHIKDYSVVPTHRYLSTALGLKHGGGIHDLLRGLERHGLTIRRPKSLRNTGAPPTVNQNSARRVNRRPAHQLSQSLVHCEVPLGSVGTEQVIR